MARTGRPRIEIRQDIFEGLCRIFCTRDEICAFLDVSEPTLRRWVKRTYSGQTFDVIYRQKSEAGNISLRRAQIKLAEAGNATMLIWLGKNRLGQVDRQEITGKDGGPIQIDDATAKRGLVLSILNKKLEKGLTEDQALEQMRLAEINPDDIAWVAGLTPEQRQAQIQELGKVG